jgi:VanZ family protein
MPPTLLWSRAGARLARSALLYVVVLAAIVTLAPFDFRIGEPAEWSTLVMTGDAVRNIAFFVPVGFLAALADGSRAAVWRAPVAATVLSLTLEEAQRWLPGRYPSVVDIVANGLGATVGAIMALIIALNVLDRQGLRTVGVLGAPLAGLAYLVTPLVWLSALVGTEADRLLIVVLAGLIGAMIIRAIGLHQLLATDEGGVPPWGEHFMLGTLVGCWFLVGIAPGTWHSRDHMAAAVIAVAVMGALPWLERERRLLVGRTGLARRERRFETRTLLQIAPLFGAYLLAVTFWPLPDGIEQWRWDNGFVPVGGSLDRTAILSVVERVAAFTAFGYGIAEWRSRRTERTSTMRWASMLPIVVVAIAVEGGRGWHPLFGASPWLFGASCAAGWVGVELFRTQRDFIVEMLALQAQRVDRERAMAIPALREEIPVPLSSTPVRALPRSTDANRAA